MPYRRGEGCLRWSTTSGQRSSCATGWRLLHKQKAVEAGKAGCRVWEGREGFKQTRCTWRSETLLAARRCLVETASPAAHEMYNGDSPAVVTRLTEAPAIEARLE